MEKKGIFISEHFSYEEVIHSDYAIENDLQDLQIAITEKHLNNARYLACHVLETIRKEVLGSRAMHVTSWYRSPKVNKKIIGSARNSRHMTGCAVDFKITGFVPKQIVNKIRKHKIFKKLCELIAYKYHTHLAIYDMYSNKIIEN